MPVILLFAMQTLALRLVDSVATVGFVTEFGVARLPWVWICELVFTLGVGAIYLRFADRWSRALLVRRLFMLSALGYLGCALLLSLGCNPALCYAMVYVWSAQQVAVLPMALWTLANELHHATDKARFFPRIAAGESMGHLAGYGLTAFIGAWLEAAHFVDVGLLVVAAGLCTAAAICVDCQPSGLRGGVSPVIAEAGVEHRPAHEPLREPRMRPLVLSVLFGWVAITVVVFHVMASLEGAAGIAPARLRMLYGCYNFGVSALTLAAQWTAGRWLARQRLEKAFVLLPAVLVVGSLALLHWEGLSGALGLAAIMYMVHDAWDVPARHAWLDRVPLAKRGRATALLDNHAFVAGSLLGSLALGLLCLNKSAAALQAPAYLALGALAATAALVAVYQLAGPRRSAERSTQAFTRMPTTLGSSATPLAGGA